MPLRYAPNRAIVFSTSTFRLVIGPAKTRLAQNQQPANDIQKLFCNRQFQIQDVVGRGPSETLCEPR
jgi:hypothetical protein